MGSSAVSPECAILQTDLSAQFLPLKPEREMRRSPLTRSEFSSACKCVRALTLQVGPEKFQEVKGTELRDQMDF